MALNAYMRLTGQTQGEIKGSVTQAGREDSIMVVEFHHEVESPVDAASGLPTGKRQHKPLVVTKEIDKSTPLLLNALTNNENITEMELRFWQPSRSGQEIQYYTIELKNARIVNIGQEMLNNQYPENMRHQVREQIAFVYQKIIWTFEDAGITAEDNWGTRSVTSSVRNSPLHRFSK
ncbi:type VI secretion system tube protein Hcp [Maribellus comscasis]|uniref:Type VI secretion system tube protein Hcp n=1 Tax=Maribellus comscasis TaxID=2681766 RepID=A0A6I6JY03_9BACT|nr:Hcp family type VI secretion system effector [Maribellus comscasis]QGY44013.1 type VI secretion system tube protein Hcp [Maribellus comscasis]